MHDLVIRNGTIIDGAGGEPYEADIAITADKIVDVGVFRGHRENTIVTCFSDDRLSEFLFVLISFDLMPFCLDFLSID